MSTDQEALGSGAVHYCHSTAIPSTSIRQSGCHNAWTTKRAPPAVIAGRCVGLRQTGQRFPSMTCAELAIFIGPPPRSRDIQTTGPIEPSAQSIRNVRFAAQELANVVRCDRLLAFREFKKWLTRNWVLKCRMAGGVQNLYLRARKRGARDEADAPGGYPEMDGPVS